MFAPSIIYAPNDPYVTLLERMSLLPVMPIPGDGTARFAPIWSQDVADCVLATLPGGERRARRRSAPATSWRGPTSSPTARLSRSCSPRRHRRRRIVAIPSSLTRRALKAVERISGHNAFATWDEAELLDVPLLAAHGTADCDRLGIHPRPMDPAVLGVG